MTHQQLTAVENIVGKGEIACNERFLLFPQFFLLNQITVSPFVHIFDIISLLAAALEEPKIGRAGKVLSGEITLTMFIKLSVVAQSIIYRTGNNGLLVFVEPACWDRDIVVTMIV